MKMCEIGVILKNKNRTRCYRVIGATKGVILQNSVWLFRQNISVPHHSNNIYILSYSFFIIFSCKQTNMARTKPVKRNKIAITIAF